MGYYLRVLSPAGECVPLSTIRDAVRPVRRDATVAADEGSGLEWTEAVVRCGGEDAIALERNLVARGSLGAEEIDEFADELADGLPRTAARWLEAYLRTVKTIYALQILSGGAEPDWEIVRVTQEAIWSAAGGVLQADGEGFTNEDGFHALWQFSDSVKGPWNMAVLDDRGAWVTFEMDLGDPEHRRAFRAGFVPATARRL